MRVLKRALFIFFISGLFASCSPRTAINDNNNIEIADGDSQIGQESQSTGSPSSQIELRDIALNNSDQVLIKLSSSVAFELKQTAASEYVVNIPGVTALAKTKLPKVASPGSKIRSARVVQEEGGVLVRMFVDQGTELKAEPQGKTILIKPTPYVRAQLAPEDDDELVSGDEDLVDGEAPAGENLARENPTGVQSSDGSKEYSGRLISLDLQDTDIDNALRIIAEVSNLNIISSEDVAGKVTLRLIDVPWDQALDVILKTNGLDQVTEGNVIRIAPIEKLRQEREALREAKRAAENLEDLSVRYLRVSYARVNDMVEHIEGVLSERGTVTADDRTNQIIVKDIRKGHEESLALVQKLDLRTPQVLLETQIVEASTNILRDLGFQWNFSYVQAAKTGNPTGYVFPNAVTVGGSTAGALPSISVDGVNSALDVLGTGGSLANFPAAISGSSGSAISAVLDSADGTRALSARLSALETEGQVKVISRPQVATVNNREATIKSVETLRVPVPDSGTSIATGTGAAADAGGGTAFEEFDVGIELTVTPQASPDFYVLLDINAKSSTFGSRAIEGIPSTIEREATSTILVKSGQTFALGGVYRVNDSDSIEGVPFLKDVPFLGHFFRRSFIEKSNDELIFFITPHIVEGSFDPSLM